LLCEQKQALKRNLFLGLLANANFLWEREGKFFITTLTAFWGYVVVHCFLKQKKGRGKLR